MRLTTAGTAAALTLASPAQAELIDVTFEGVVSKSPENVVLIVDEFGAGRPWTGPVPDYPYKNGDTVKLSFQVEADTSQPPQSADGTYRWTIVGEGQDSAYPLVDNTDGFATIVGQVGVTGPIEQAGDFGEPFNGTAGMTLVHNPATGGYALELAEDGFSDGVLNQPSGQYSIGRFNTPGYIFDPVGSELSLVDSNFRFGFPCGQQANVLEEGCSAIIGDFGLVDFYSPSIWDANGNYWGTFDLSFDGNWFVNGQQTSGSDPIVVPEPGAAGLFGLGLLGLGAAARRRRTKGVKTA
jgi:hypothetical protein